MSKDLTKVQQQLYDAALKECRYYKGEEQCPYSHTKEADKEFLWQCEAAYCHMQYDANSNSVFVRYVAEMSRVGFGALPNKLGQPLRLIALLFSQYAERYKHTTKGFEEFIKAYYK